MVDLHSFCEKCVSKLLVELENEGIINEDREGQDSEAYLQEIFGSIINNDTLSFIESEAIQKSFEEEYLKLATVEITEDEVFTDKYYNLSPVKHITEKKNYSHSSQGFTNLGDVAEVLRCQEPRVPYHMDAKIDSLEKVLREISLKDIDSSTAFTVFDNADCIKIKPKDDKYERFILQDNDIVLAFKGSRATLGTIGFIDFSLDKKIDKVKEEQSDENNSSTIPILCSTSLVIVRVKDKQIDPLWLFYQLQEKRVQEAIMSRATGSSVLSVNANAIKQIQIALPNEKDLAELTEYHTNIHAHFSEIIRRRRSIEALKHTRKKQQDINN